jgi:phosphoribosylformylglycinamidine cyclo-ligase
MARQDEYRRSGVDYDVLDEVKREAIALAAATAPLLAASSGAEVGESRGSSAYVFEVHGTTLALVVEGLGTKSIIASDYLDATGISRFADIAQDAVAAIVNDVISVGASPLVVTAYFATGDAAWYSHRDRSLDLLNGWRAACEEAGAVWGGGESPALPGIVTPGAIELAGSALGLVPPGRAPVLGRDIAAGDKIILVPSSGLHANGASRPDGSGVGSIVRCPGDPAVPGRAALPDHCRGPGRLDPAAQGTRHRPSAAGEPVTARRDR